MCARFQVKQACNETPKLQNFFAMNKHVLIPIFLLLAFAGCRSGSEVTTQHYLLEMPAEYEFIWEGEPGPLPASCEVLGPDVVPAYSSHRIAVREESHQIRYFGFNEWAIRPDQVFHQMVVDFLKENRVFEELAYGRVVIPADYVLETEIIHLEADNRQEMFRARLHVEFRLRENETDKILLTHREDRMETLEGRNLNDFAETVSRMFTEELAAFTESITGEVNRNQ